MSDPMFMLRLTDPNLDEHLSLSLHEQTTQRAAVREALTRLRTGESPALVAARLEDTCPELLAHHIGGDR